MKTALVYAKLCDGRFATFSSEDVACIDWNRASRAQLSQELLTLTAGIGVVTTLP